VHITKAKLHVLYKALYIELLADNEKAMKKPLRLKHVISSLPNRQTGKHIYNFFCFCFLFFLAASQSAKVGIQNVLHV